DQELAEKVEELQVMGRIVRELNASLEVDRAMRTTLEWAMRRTNAEAGLIGMIGYDHVLSPEDARLPLLLPALKTAVENGQPNQVSLIGNGSKGILPTAHTQI